MAGYLDGYKDAVGHLLDVTYIKGGSNRSSGSLSGKEREAVKERFRVTSQLQGADGRTLIRSSRN
jgi:hypothetical protein